ncbi:hypothetical protein O6H91_16G067300 [Diphasiastrum complanatum]|uniref:Uncharacterized protein n=1 Tax=Diphasiastrum complanatum TaxID=34168 RepID=A0ACC2BD99_DIPCM|nr:hypothetical protein O6H91_16G067300 [Diphasiastrum complanatum]
MTFTCIFFVAYCRLMLSSSFHCPIPIDYGSFGDIELANWLNLPILFCDLSRKRCFMIVLLFSSFKAKLSLGGRQDAYIFDWYTLLKYLSRAMYPLGYMSCAT